MKEDIRKRIEVAAYLTAEAEGFPPGREQDFWRQAEARVMSELAEEGRSKKAPVGKKTSEGGPAVKAASARSVTAKEPKAKTGTTRAAPKRPAAKKTKADT